MPKEIIAVWFSCGAASAAAACLTLQKYRQTHDVRIINNPISEEDEDNQRFLHDVECWLDVKIERAINPKFPNCSIVEVFDKRNYMSGVLGAPCTYELKKRARQNWESENKPDWHVLGFTYEEKERSDRFMFTERSNVIPILIENKMTKADCFFMMMDAGIKLPDMYRKGYPNANCPGCVKAASPTYWNHVRKVHPDVFLARSEQSRRIGAKLVKYKGSRIFLDELPPDARGQAMRDMNFECGIFCEERS